MRNMLTKHPLLKMESNIVFGAHRFFPHNENLFQKDLKQGVKAFLLHYKFLPGEVQKFMEYIATEIHYRGSKEYKIYMEFYKQNPDISFYHSESQKLNSSMDLLKINLSDKKFFDELLDWDQSATG